MIDFKLFEYQRKDIDIMKNLKRSINANPMGLGKTLESIVLADEIGAQAVLIVAPTHLLGNWEREIHKFSKNPDCVIIKGTRKQRIVLLNEQHRFYIINKETI